MTSLRFVAVSVIDLGRIGMDLDNFMQPIESNRIEPELYSVALHYISLQIHQHESPQLTNIPGFMNTPQVSISISIVSHVHAHARYCRKGNCSRRRCRRRLEAASSLSMQINTSRAKTAIPITTSTALAVCWTNTIVPTE